VKIVSRTTPTLVDAYRTGIKETACIVLLSIKECREIAKSHSDPAFINALLDTIDDALIAHDWTTFDED